jgi:hypothetical protein
MQNLYRKMLSFQKNAPKIHKNCTANIGNRQYRYADLSSILDVVLPALNSIGILLTQSFEGMNLVTKVTDSETGETFEGQTWHGIGSAISYARRYSIITLIGVGVDDDDDAHSTINQPRETKQHRDLCEVCGDEKRLSQTGKTYCHTCWQLKRNGYANGVK